MTDMITAPSELTATHDGDADYQATVLFDAPPEAVFDALTATAGLAGWWAPVSGSGADGGDLRFVFNDPLLIHVDQAQRLSSVRWTVVECSFLPDWVGTTLRFDLRPRESGGCEVRFRHQGLTPRLECFSLCRAGWDHQLASLHDYVASGQGQPFGSEGHRRARAGAANQR
jgi:uncharacterized protein YndB with AHSA1/START domain